MKYIDMAKDAFLRIFPSPYTPVVILAICLLAVAGLFKLCSKKLSITGNNTVKACYDIIYLFFTAFVALGMDKNLDRVITCLPFWSQLSSSATMAAFMTDKFPYFVLELYKLLLVAIIAGMINVFVEPNLQKMSPVLSFFGWFFWEFVTVTMGFVVCWGVNELIRNYLKESMMAWIPASLFLLLAVLMIIVFLKLVFRAAAFLNNAGVNNMYDFFTKQTFGHAVSAAFTAILVLVPALIYMEDKGIISKLTSGSITIVGSLYTILMLMFTGFVVSKWL